MNSGELFNVLGTDILLQSWIATITAKPWLRDPWTPTGPPVCTFIDGMNTRPLTYLNYRYDISPFPFIVCIYSSMNKCPFKST